MIKILRAGYKYPQTVKRWLTGQLKRLPKPVSYTLLGLVGVLLVVGGLQHRHHKQYTLSAKQRQLLSEASVDLSKIKETTDSISYNREDETIDSPQVPLTVDSQEDATGKVPYRATLAKNASQGMTFGDAKGDLSFKLIPLHRMSGGDYQHGQVLYPEGANKRHVYTFKRNGVKEDIILNKSPGKTAQYQWKLELSDKLEARLLPDGGVGVYSATPYLYGDLQISDAKSQELIDKARQNGKKDYLMFVLPAPYIKQVNSQENREDVSFRLTNNILTLEARNLDNKNYPLSIDPSVTITTTADFNKGKDDGMIDYGTSGQINRGSLSLGNMGAWDTDSDSYFTTPRDNHATVAYNGFIYIIGGQQGNSDADCKDGSSPSSDRCNDVQYAQINGDGVPGDPIGAWTTDTDSYFNFPRYQFSAVAYNGYLYVMGGSHASLDTDCKNTGASIRACNDVQYASIDPVTGALGTWTTDSDSYFDFPRTGHATVAYNGFMYILGGALESASTNCKNTGLSVTSCNDVQYAPINADGSLGGWTTDSDSYFEYSRSSLRGVAYNGRLYITGGIMSSASTNCKNTGASTSWCNDIQYASINTDGSIIGSWTINSTYFDFPRSSPFIGTYAGYFYISGGALNTAATDCKNTGTSVQYCNDVQYAPINADGSLGSWTTDSDSYLAVPPRSNLAGAVYNGYLYITGGSGNSSVTTCKPGGATSENRCNDTQAALINTGTPTFGGTGGKSFTTDPNSWFSTPRYQHSAIAYNGYIYVIGGEDGGGRLSNVQYAPINSDGSLGSWATASSLNTARGNHASVVYNGYVYAIGGVNSGNGSTTSVEYAPINADGSLGTWIVTNSLVNKRQGLDAAAYNGYLYVTGGRDGTNTTACKNGGSSPDCNDVLVGAINSDGSIIWDGSRTTYFSNPRYDHSTVAYNGYLYIVAGFDSSLNLYSDVQYAQITSTGALAANSGCGSTWCTTTSLPGARYGHASVAYNGYLYAIGGWNGSPMNSVVYAAFNSNGTVGSWTTNSNDFNLARGWPGSVSYNGYLYVVGGYLGGGSSSTGCKNGGTSSYCNDTQYVGLDGPDHRATYERIIDTGTLATSIDTVTFNGQAVCGMELRYRTAGSNGVFGSTTQLPFVSPGNSYSINHIAKRYIWVKFTLKDEACGTTSNITDVTVNYTITPSAPTLSAPAAGAVGVTNQPQFQLRSYDVQDDYLRYKVEVCSNADCSTVLRTIDQTASQTGWTGQDQQTNTAYTGNTDINSSTMATHNYQTPALNWGTQYWWRAYAIDPAGTNTWSVASPIQAFTTNQIPDAPALVLPANGNTGVSRTPQFQLRSTDDNDYLQYKIELCSTSNCSVIIATIDQTSSQTGWTNQNANGGTAYSSSLTLSNSQMGTHTWQLAQLNTNTQYWWRAYAIDPAGRNTWSSASSINTFTTPTVEIRIWGGTKIMGGTKIGT